MVTAIALKLHRVLNKIMVERNGRFTYRTWERILHQTHIIIIDVHILEHLLKHGVEHLTSLEDLIDTAATLTEQYGLFFLRIFAILEARHGFIHRDWEDEFIIHG